MYLFRIPYNCMLEDREFIHVERIHRRTNLQMYNFEKIEV